MVAFLNFDFPRDDDVLFVCEGEPFIGKCLLKANFVYQNKNISVNTLHGVTKLDMERIS